MGRKARHQLWGGRFEQGTDPALWAFNRSLPVDRRLWREDLMVSAAHARALAVAGVISRKDAEVIGRALRAIARDIEQGRVDLDTDEEDIHSLLERLLIEQAGPVGARLHAGRSRNDQVVADLRVWLRRSVADLVARTEAFVRALLDVAEATHGAVMPAYTHLQAAQPVLFAHHLLAYAEMALRDRDRLQACARRADLSPLGAGACAGVTFPLDRRLLARLLGFQGVLRNSLDAVADRDFALEFVAAAGIAMTHLSRLAEDIVLWASPGFGFVELADAIATGSSIMPQKRNPDGAELVRGKAGRVAGRFVHLAMVLKGLPLAYNKDLQEDKEAVFDAVDTLAASLDVMAVTLHGLRPRPDRMRAACEAGYLEATDLADHLVRSGMPFREAHGVVGRLVREAVTRGVGLADLPIEVFRAEVPGIGLDLYEAIRIEQCVAARDVEGGTAPQRVAGEIRRLRRLVGGVPRSTRPARSGGGGTGARRRSGSRGRSR